MTREEFINIVYSELSSDSDNSRANRIIDAADRYAEEKADWIPISEENLPKESSAVFVWTPERKNIYCAYLKEKQWWIFGAYFQKLPFEVTAWMPLPKPFKAESEK